MPGVENTINTLLWCTLLGLRFLFFVHNVIQHGNYIDEKKGRSSSRLQMLEIGSFKNRECVV